MSGFYIDTGRGLSNLYMLSPFSVTRKLKPRKRACLAQPRTAPPEKPLYKSRGLDTVLLPFSLVSIPHTIVELILKLVELILKLMQLRRTAREYMGYPAIGMRARLRSMPRRKVMVAGWLGR